MQTFKTYCSIVFVCLLQKISIFDLLGVSGDGSDWGIGNPPPIPHTGPKENLQRGRVRPAPLSLSLFLWAWDPGVQAFSGSSVCLVWPLCTSGLGLGIIPGPETCVRVGLPPGRRPEWASKASGRKAVVFWSLKTLPLLNWISGLPLA